MHILLERARRLASMERPIEVLALDGVDLYPTSMQQPRVGSGVGGGAVQGVRSRGRGQAGAERAPRD